MKASQPSPPTKSVPRSKSPPTRTATCTSKVIDLASPETKKSRTKKKRFLRCGWAINVDGSYIAPDGRRFSTRDEAAKYHNCDVVKLEPARKDSWQVYTNEAGTHMDWIAPDGTKFHSYTTAVVYSRKIAQPLYGRDGITRGLGCFFATKAKTKSSTQTVHTPEPIAHSSCSDEGGTVDEQSTPENVPRKFVIPTQTAAGEDLQSLCRMLANTKVTGAKQSKLEEQLEQYFQPSQLEKSMTNKVMFANNSVSTNTM
jgi:hypothetical protein